MFNQCGFMSGSRRRFQTSAFVAVVIELSIPSIISDVVAQDKGALPPVPTSSIDRTALDNIFTKNPDVFSGLTVDYPNLTATVYAVTSQLTVAKTRLSGITHLVRTSDDPEPLTLQFKTVERSWSRLQKTMQAVTDDPTLAGQSDTHLHEWYVDPSENCVSLGVSEVTPTLRAAAGRLFSGDVCFHIADGGTTTWDRQHDIEPFAGGARMFATRGACTLGFPILNPNGYESWRMLTSGHCVSLGEQPTAGGGGAVVGDVTLQQHAQNGIDTAVISNKNYYWMVYNGGPSSTTFSNLGGQIPVAKGDQMLASGASLGEVGPWTVTNPNTCHTFTDDGITSCHLIIATYTGLDGVTGGDSGGPVYVPIGSKVYATGIITGQGNFGKTMYATDIYSAISPLAGWRVAKIP
jgi:hypothetical protein